MSDITFGVKPDKEINLASPYVYATDSDGSGDSGGSGGGAMYLVMTEDGDDYTYNYSSSEIRNAIINHVPIYFSTLEDGNYTDILPMTSFIVDDEMWGVTFTGIASYAFSDGDDNAHITIQRVEVYDEGDGIVAETETTQSILIGTTSD